LPVMEWTDIRAGLDREHGEARLVRFLMPQAGYAQDWFARHREAPFDIALLRP